MEKIAITGNIASGKSQVEKILLSHGFRVVDCDKINSELLNKNIQVINEIKTIFGAEIFDGKDKISKPKLAQIVFSDFEKKQKLEKILHKRILNEINNFFDKNKNEKEVFVAVPLLFEVGWQNKFDKIIFISADEKIRLKRLMQRNNLTESQAKLRINAQNDEKLKIEKSDFVIYNNSDLTTLEKNTLNIINMF